MISDQARRQDQTSQQSHQRLVRIAEDLEMAPQELEQDGVRREKLASRFIIAIHRLLISGRVLCLGEERILEAVSAA
jgi:hypothetical protein